MGRKMSKKDELLLSAALLDDRRNKATKQMELAEADIMREAWERVILAYQQGADALRREAEAVAVTVQIGDVIPHKLPSTWEANADGSPFKAHSDQVRAVVEYVHPEGRFYTVRFEMPIGSFCECFDPEQLDWRPIKKVRSRRSAGYLDAQSDAILELYRQGLTVPEIAARLSLNKTSLYQWMQRRRAAGKEL